MLKRKILAVIAVLVLLAATSCAGGVAALLLALNKAGHTPDHSQD